MYLCRVCLCLSFKSYEARFCCFFNIPMFVYFCISARDGEFQQCTVAVHIFVYIFWALLTCFESRSKKKSSNEGGVLVVKWCGKRNITGGIIQPLIIASCCISEPLSLAT